MHKDNHQSPLAISYALALLELANESKSADSVGQEMRDLRQIIDSNPLFAQVLADPAISQDERGKLIHRVFEGQASQLMLNFMGLVNEKNRLSLLHLGLLHGKLRTDCFLIEVEALTLEIIALVELVRLTLRGAIGQAADDTEVVEAFVGLGLQLRLLLIRANRCRASTLRHQVALQPRLRVLIIGLGRLKL